MTTIILCIVGWFLSAIITGILVVKVEKWDFNRWDISEIMLLAILWPLALIIVMCEARVMYVEYIKTRKERVENLKQEKRDEVESVLKVI